MCVKGVLVDFDNRTVTMSVNGHKREITGQQDRDGKTVAAPRGPLFFSVSADTVDTHVDVRGPLPPPED